MQLANRCRHMRPFEGHQRTLEKMPFVRDMFVYSTSPVDFDAVPGVCRRIVDCKEDLLACALLMSDPAVHPLGHEEPAVAIANGTLFIDCTERFARGLGVTFAKMRKYSGKGGSLGRVFLKLSIQKYHHNARFHFAVGQLFRKGGIHVIVPSDNTFVCPEHSLNINSPAFPNEKHDIFLWSALVALNCKPSEHTEATIDCTRRSSVHVYRFRGGLFAAQHIDQIIKDRRVVCVVGIAADAVIKFTDHSLPSVSHLPPASFALYKQPESGGAIQSINYV